ncbi:MAG: SRPBCC domain-containing protein [Rhodospirillaceae bacterium]|nr:SRPBCC domain-containing protein [Rhodospirillaceae bacterium]
MTSTKTGGVTIDTATGVLRISDTIPVPIKTAWTMLTSRQHISKWWGDYVSIELRPGGTFEELWTAPDGRQTRAFGTVKQIAAPHLLEVTWREDSWEYSTTVHVQLRQVGEGTHITIIHKDWPAPVTDLVRGMLAKHYYGWRSCLMRLKNHATQHDATQHPVPTTVA